MSHPHVCTSTTCISSVLGSQKRALDALGLELHMEVNFMWILGTVPTSLQGKPVFTTQIPLQPCNFYIS